MHLIIPHVGVPRRIKIIRTANMYCSQMSEAKLKGQLVSYIGHLSLLLVKRDDPKMKQIPKKEFRPPPPCSDGYAGKLCAYIMCIFFFKEATSILSPIPTLMNRQGH